MSLIRTSTRLPNGRTSSAYAWHATSGYFMIVVAPDRPKRRLFVDRDGHHGIKLTKAEMDYMVKEYVRQYLMRGPA